ncbi:Ku protein [Streptomyces sp. ACA25]|uniref:non-homologous end joining protein Ku n=1 Tax=Streptomyces sp. ACA25 TaxID=3022596 RepID=UPI0023077ABC|nr:Ku protein [Streptomyces sp. ACA25]MDB1088989.1 Ku protein [Streptomyces sp. ACA25]
MRAIWKGAISFGLVSIPVKVVGATESHSVSFRQLHTADGGRIRYRKVCELDEEEVTGEEIGKAYEAPDGTLVQLTDEDLASLPLPTAKTVEILGFVPVESIDLIQLDRSYYLEPETGADKPYVLLRRALGRSGKGAIAKLAMRGRENLALLRPLEDDVLGLHTMLWPDEIRSAAGIAPDSRVTVRDAELDLADALMDSLGEIDPNELHDDYRSAVDALVTAKLAGTEPSRPGEPAAAGGKVIDLMSALEDSVRAARESRGDGAEATVTSLRQPSAEDEAVEDEAESAEPAGAGKAGRQSARGPAKKKPPAKKAARKPGKEETAKEEPAKKAAGKKAAGKKNAEKKTTTGKKTAASKKAEEKTAARKRAGRAS